MSNPTAPENVVDDLAQAAEPRWRPVGVLARALNGFYWAQAALLCGIAFGVGMVVMQFGSESEDGVTAWARYINVLSLLLGLVGLVVGPLLLVWFYRAYANLTALGATDLRYSPAWAVGAWFIPFANLVLPKRIAAELWRASERPHNAQHRSAEAPRIVSGWWAKWVWSYVLVVVSFGVIGASVSAVNRGGVVFGLVLMASAFLTAASAARSTARLVTEVTFLQCRDV